MTTTPFDAPDWRGMSQQDRDSRSSTMALRCAGSADIAAGWEQLSADMRARHPAHLDLQIRSRASATGSTFLNASGWRADAGVYPRRLLADPRQGSFLRWWPKVRWRTASTSHCLVIRWRRMRRSTRSSRKFTRGLDFLIGQLPALGGDPTRNRGVRLVRRRAPDLDGAVASAGQSRAWPSAGIYDLEPIRHSYLNVKLEPR